MSRLLIVCVFFFVATLGCSSAPSATADAPATVQAAPFDAAHILEQHRWLVAPDVATVAIIDAELAWDLFALGATDRSTLKAKPLVQDLRDLYVDRLGIDITHVSAVLVAFGPTRQTILIAGDFPQADGEALRFGTRPAYRLALPESRQMPSLVAVQIPGTGIALFTDEAALQTTLSALQADSAPADAPQPDDAPDASSPLHVLETLIAKLPGHRIAIAVNAGHDALRSELMAGAPDLAVDTAVFGLGRDGFQADLHIEADAALLEHITEQVDGFRSKTLEHFDQELATIDELDLGDATQVLIRHHTLRPFVDQLTPVREGNQLSYHAKLESIDAMVVLGVISGISIPAYNGYLERSQADTPRDVYTYPGQSPEPEPAHP